MIELLVIAAFVALTGHAIRDGIDWLQPSGSNAPPQKPEKPSGGSGSSSHSLYNDGYPVRTDVNGHKVHHGSSGMGDDTVSIGGSDYTVGERLHAYSDDVIIHAAPYSGDGDKILHADGTTEDLNSCIWS